MVVVQSVVEVRLLRKGEGEEGRFSMGVAFLFFAPCDRKLEGEWWMIWGWVLKPKFGGEGLAGWRKWAGVGVVGEEAVVELRESAVECVARCVSAWQGGGDHAG